MAVCTNCGKELNDGEVCTCTKTTSDRSAQINEMSAKVKAETGKAVGSMMTLAKAVLNSPAEAVAEYVAGQDKKSAYQLIALEAVGFALADVLYQILRFVTKGSKFYLSSLLTGVLEDVALVIGVMAVASFLITYMADKYGNTKIDFNKGLAIASLQSIAITPVYVVYTLISGLGVTILTQIGSMAYQAAQCLAIILTWLAFSVVVSDKKKLFYGMGTYSLVLALVRYVIASII